jgi:hypothetical protein
VEPECPPRPQYTPEPKPTFDAPPPPLPVDEPSSVEEGSRKGKKGGKKAKDANPYQWEEPEQTRTVQELPPPPPPEYVAPVVEEKGAEDDCMAPDGGKEAKMGKKNQFDWEEEADPAPIPATISIPVYAPSPPMSVTGTATQSKVVMSVIPSSTSDLPGGFGASDASSQTTQSPPAQEGSGSSSSGWFGKVAALPKAPSVAKKTNLFGGWGGGWTASAEEEQPIISSPEPEPAAALPPTHASPLPPPGPGTGLALAPVQAEPEEPMEDWFAAARKRNDRRTGRFGFQWEEPTEEAQAVTPVETPTAASTMDEDDSVRWPQEGQEG